MASEDITGGTYGATVEADVADTLFDSEETTDQATEPEVGVETAKQDETEDSQQPVEAKESQEGEPTEVAEPQGFEYEGKVYSADELTEAIKDSTNKGEWQKSNTQKAQELSDRERELKSEFDRIKSIRNDDDVSETLKDLLGEDHEFFKEPSVKFSESEKTQDTNDAVKSEEFNETEGRIMELESQLEDMKLQELVKQEVNQLVFSHPELKDDPDAIVEVMDLATKRNIPSLEDAYTIAVSQVSEESALQKAIKKVEEVQSLKDIPEQDGNSKGNHGPEVTKPKNYEDAREMAFNDYELYA